MTRLEWTGRALKVLRIVYLTGLAILVVWVIRFKWPDVAALVVGVRPWLVIASLASSFGLIALGAWFWVDSLRIQGHRAPGAEVFGHALLATSRSLLARYVPGSIWFAVGRVGLLRNAGLPVGSLSATAVLEMATSLIVVLTGGLAILGLSGQAPGGAGWMIAVALALVTLTSPPVGGRVVTWLAARRGIEVRLTWRGYLRLIGINMIFWGWSATTFLLYLRAFPSTDIYRTIVVVGGFLLTWGAGFLAPIAPQGIGVFEAAMANVLSAEGVVETAVVLVGYRSVLLARDIIATPVAEVIATRRELRGSVRRGPSPEYGGTAGSDPGRP